MNPTAPWWGVGVLTGGFTLLAAIFTQIYGNSREKIKLRAARTDKMNDLSRDAAATYLAEIDKNMNMLLHPAHDPYDPQLELDLHKALNAIPLACSAQVTDASVTLVRALNKTSNTHKQLDRKGFVGEHHLAFKDARDAFVNAVRAEQGLPALPKEITQRPPEGLI